MTNPALDANETLRQLEMHIGWATGINKEACLAMCKELRTALANAPQVVTVSSDQFEQLWQDAYNKSRGSSVFNSQPSFKKCLMDNLALIGLKITASPNGV